MNSPKCNVHGNTNGEYSMPMPIDSIGMDVKPESVVECTFITLSHRYC